MGGLCYIAKVQIDFCLIIGPPIIQKPKVALVWDLNNKKYVDFSVMSVGTNILGYANKSINKHVINQIKKSNISTLNSFSELTLAKELLKIDKWGDKVRFAKTGGEILAISIRLARVFSGKDTFFCGYHGRLDWYLSSNIQNNKNLNDNLISNLSFEGIPSNLKNTCFPLNGTISKTLKSNYKK